MNVCDPVRIFKTLSHFFDRGCRAAAIVATLGFLPLGGDRCLLEEV